MKKLKIYVAGKMSAHPGYKTHNWRDEFLKEISKLSGLSFISYDPVIPPKTIPIPRLYLAVMCI